MSFFNSLPTSNFSSSSPSFSTGISSFSNPITASNISTNFGGSSPFGGSSSFGSFGTFGNNVLNTSVFGGGGSGSTFPNFATSSQSFVPSFGTPSFGTPSFGTPSFGTPSIGTPSFGTPFSSSIPSIPNLPTLPTITPTLPTITPIVPATVGTISTVNNIPQPSGVIPNTITGAPTIQGQDGSPLLKLVVDQLCINSNFIGHIDYPKDADIDDSPNVGIGIQFISSDSGRTPSMLMHKQTTFRKPLKIEKTADIISEGNTKMITQDEDDADGHLKFHTKCEFLGKGDNATKIHALEFDGITFEDGGICIS